MFKITADGMSFADSGLSIASNHSFDNDDLKRICRDLCAENAVHSFNMILQNATGWNLTATKVETTKVTGNITGATNGTVSVELYNVNNALLTKYNTTVTDGAISIDIDNTIIDSVKKVIVSQGVKAGFIDEFNNSLTCTLKDAYSITGSTYDIKKASANGSWTYDDTGIKRFVSGSIFISCVTKPALTM